MKESLDDKSVRSFFPKIFASKLPGYAKGEPEAYLFNQAKTSKTDPNAPTYFQRWVLKAIENNKSKEKLESDATSVSAVDDLQDVGGIDISRMFDEIELIPEIMNDEEGVSEYSLALADVNQMNERMTKINIEAAKIFLNENKDDLNDFAKKLLNDSMPGSYDRLIDILKPKSQDFTEAEKIAQARKKLAYAFVDATRTCYCQKLQDINSAKHEPLGLEIVVKSLSREDLNNYSVQKLTLIEVKYDGPPKYYIYGNGDGESWALREIPVDVLGKIDFESENKLPSINRYSSIHNYIEMNKLHTLPKDFQEQNIARKKALIDFYQKVISPIETLNRRPITSESFDFKATNKATFAEAHARVQLELQLALNAKYLLNIYRDKVKNESELKSIDASIASLEIIIQEAYAINDFINLDLPVDEKMQSFLTNPISQQVKTVIKAGVVKVIEDIKVDLRDFDSKVSSDVDLHTMIENELEKLDVTAQSEIDVNFEFPFDSRIYCIMQLDSEYDNLNNLMHGIDEMGFTPEMVEEYKNLIVNQIKVIAIIEVVLKTSTANRKDIIRANEILSRPIVNIAREYASACKNEDADKKSTMINELKSHVDKARIESNLINLSRYLEDNGAEDYFYTIKEIGNYLHNFKGYSFQTVEEMSGADQICITAEKLQKYNNLPESAVDKRQQLAKDIKNNLQMIETWYKNQGLVILARANLDALSKYVENLDDSYNKDKINLLIENAKLSISDDSVRFDDSRQVQRLLNTDIIKLANKSDIRSGSNLEEIANFNAALRDVGSQELKKTSSFSFQTFKSLFNNQTRKVDPKDRDEVESYNDKPSM